MSIVPWVSIEAIHHVLSRIDNGRVSEAVRHVLQRTPGGSVAFLGKTKLHGANHAVVAWGNTVRLQSRKVYLGGKNGDAMQFATWAEHGEVARFFSSLAKRACSVLPASLSPTEQRPLYVFGEWCGPGIQPKSDVALGKIPKKVFAVFSLRLGGGEGAQLIVHPDEILAVLTSGGASLPPDVHVIPWLEKRERSLCLCDTSALATEVVEIERLVAAVDAEDPWVRDVFGISGPGEGVVWYPVGACETLKHGSRTWHLLLESILEELSFKTKGTHFLTGERMKPVSITLVVTAFKTQAQFVRAACQHARLMQGVSETCSNGDISATHCTTFVDWVVADVHKECNLELKASGLSWDQVDGSVKKYSREWFQQLLQKDGTLSKSS